MLDTTNSCSYELYMQVEEITKQVKILEAYLEQRGVSLPKGQLIGRVILPNPNCRYNMTGIN